MKQVIFILCIFCVGLLSAQKDQTTEPVLANMDAQQKAWNRGDIRGFMEHYWNSDSLKFITSKSVSYGWQTTLDNYLKSYPDKEAMGRLTFTIVEATALSDSSVYVIGKWSLLKARPSGGHFTLLWKKLNGKWVIVSDHTS